MDATARGPLARLVASPRRRVGLAIAGLAVVVRAVLPSVLQPILLERADAALVGHVELEDLDLSLLRGGVTLHGLVVHTDERPAETPPLLEARRLWTQISWLALLGRTIEVEDFELEGFTVHLDREAEGLRLPRLAEREPAAQEDAKDEATGAWSYAADAVSLRDGRVELVDHTVAGEPERIELAIEDLSARELAVRTNPGDEEPGRIAIEAKLDQGSVSLSSWIQSDADAIDVRSTVVLDDIPIDELRPYLAAFGWSELSGQLDASLEHHFVTGGAHTLSGRAALADLHIALPQQPEPALTWKALEVELDDVDLVKHHAAIARITSRGARVVVDPRAEVPLALLAGRTPVPARAPAQDDAPPSTPGWTWQVAQLAVEDAVVALHGAPEPLPLAIGAALAQLSSEPGRRSPLSLTVAAGADGDQGTLRLAGELATSPPAFDGRLAVEDLELAPLLARIDAPAVHWLTRGRLRTDLLLRAARDLRATGRIGLADLDLEEAKTAKQFGIAWKDLELGIQSFSLRDLVPAPDAAAERAVDLSLARIVLVAPRLVLTRGESGIVLPPLRPGDAPDEVAATEAVEPADPAPAETESTAEAGAEERETPTEGDADEPALPIRIRIAEARIEDGRLVLADRKVEPFYRGRIKAIALQATGVRWPENEAESIALTAEGLKGARLALSGSLHREGSKLEGELVQLPLAQFNPYLASTGYDLKSGALSLESRIRLAPNALKTKSRVVVSALEVGGSDGAKAFQESFGLPLEVALGLLKDLDGKITLAVPVAGKPDEMKVGVARLVAQALRKALVGALAAPLKLLGVATGMGARDDAIADATPAPIPFQPGETLLGPEAEERVEEIAGLLTASPGIALRLAGQTDAADRRIVCERALLKQLEASRGVRALASLGEIATRRAVREHLARKLAGRTPPPLAAHDASWLESQLAHATAPAEVLESLAVARAEALRAALTSEHGIAPTRLMLDPARVSPPAPVPGVAVSLGVPAEDGPDEADDDADDAAEAG
ncbi:MAG: DUF748 domain-containing protein [Myxococcota bacterium]